MNFEKPNWRIALFSAVFFGLFCSLSIWQYDRGQEKIELIAEMQAKANLPGEMLTRSLLVENGDPIRANGRFISEKVFLLDNRVLNGRVGYEVVQLFEDLNGTLALVNRGFIGGQLTREELPTVPEALGVVQAIRGHAYLSEMAVPDQNLAGPQSPWVIQVAKPQYLEAMIDGELFSHVIRLEESHPNALPRHWPVTIMSPERHFGYTLTWFLMAIAVVIAFVYSMKADKQTKIERE